jgi:hypothetical protein
MKEVIQEHLQELKSKMQLNELEWLFIERALICAFRDGSRLAFDATKQLLRETFNPQNKNQ